MERTPMKAPASWTLSLPPPPAARLKLYCFAHAGGGASAFVRWPQRLPSDVHVIPVQLPGRENRFNEPMPRSAPELVDAVVSNIAFGDGPFAFIGHSMGAVLSFEVARALRRAGKTLPKLLIASASTPPQGGYGHITIHQVFGPDMVAQLRKYGTPEVVLGNKEILDLFAPVIQADSRLVHAYRYTPEPPLPVPLVLYHAVDDPTVDVTRLEGWRELTSARFSMRTFRGGHMYLHPGDDLFFAGLAEDLGSAIQR